MAVTSGNTSPDPTDADFRLYEIYRARVVAEDQLVNIRLTWILLLQAPLFAVVAGILLDALQLMQQGGLGFYKYLQIIVLILLGIFAFSFLLFGAWAIRAAFQEINYLKDQYAKASSGRPQLPAITGQELRHFAGVVLPSMIIAGLTGCWIVILLFGITLLARL
jgi:hypothetical protein